MKKIYVRYKQFWNYFMYGLFTALINISLFLFLNEKIGMHYLLANVLAITAAIIFSYVVNKRYVFRTHVRGRKALLQEFLTFVSFRVTAAAMDMGGLFILVQFIRLNANISKIIVEIIIATTNYIVSKYFIFKKEDK